MNRKDIINLAVKAGLAYKSNGHWWIDAGPIDYELEKFAMLVAEQEREACAKVCEEEADRVAEHCALAIRGRKE
jgi:hypothetical protein